MEDKETVTLLPGQTIIGTKYTKSSYVERLEQENAELKAENERMIESLGLANKYVNKYHQTLQEIKEIAENEIDDGHCGECSSTKHCKLYPYWQITQLITKAEEE